MRRYPDNFGTQKPNDIDELSDLMQELGLLRERIAILEAERHGVFCNPLVLTVPVDHEQTETSTVTEIADVHDAHITVQRQQGAIAIVISTPQSSPATPRNIRQSIPRFPLTDSERDRPSHASVCMSSSGPNVAPFVTSSLHQPAMYGNPVAPAPPPMPSSQQPAMYGDPVAPAPPPMPSLQQPAMFGNPVAPAPMPIPATPIPFVPPQPNGSTLSWGQMMTPSDVQELLAPQPENGEYYVVTKGRRPGVYLSWPEAHELVDGLSSPCYWKKNNKYAAQGQYTIAYNKGSCGYRYQ